MAVPTQLEPVRGVFTTDVTRSGVGQTTDGLTVGSTGATERWLLASSGIASGIYDVTPAGVWTRSSDQDAPSEFIFGNTVRVRGGNTYGNSVWYFEGPENPTLGSSILTYKLDRYGTPREAGEGLEVNAGLFRLPQRAQAQGSHDIGPLSITHDDRGIATFVEPGYEQQTYISGLTLEWASIATLTVRAGEAWSPGIGENLALEVDRVSDSVNTYPGPSLGYVYLDGNNTFSVYQTTPTSPYRGSARVMTGVSYARYIGSILYLPAGGNICRFRAEPLSANTMLVTYLDDTQASPFRVVTNSAVVAETSVNLGPSGANKLVPPTARMALLRVRTSGGTFVNLGNSEDASANGIFRVGFGATGTVDFPPFLFPLDASQSFTYWNSAAGGGTYIDCLGYLEKR